MKISERVELFDSIGDVPFCLAWKNAFYCFSGDNLLRKKLALSYSYDKTKQDFVI